MLHSVLLTCLYSLVDFNLYSFILIQLFNPGAVHQNTAQNPTEPHRAFGLGFVPRSRLCSLFSFGFGWGPMRYFDAPILVNKRFHISYAHILLRPFELLPVGLWCSLVLGLIEIDLCVIIYSTMRWCRATSGLNIKKRFQLQGASAHTLSDILSQGASAHTFSDILSHFWFPVKYGLEVVLMNSLSDTSEEMILNILFEPLPI